MGLSYNSNISALGAKRQLDSGTEQLARTLERLGSGQRINRASDDAAGLSISQSLKSSRLVFAQGIRNLNDGLSLLNIADSTLNSLSDITQRLRELATQAAQGTLSLAQRAALNTEARELAEEYFRLSRGARFNGLSLLNGSLGQLRLQAGYGVDGGIASGLGGAVGTGTFAAGLATATANASNEALAVGDVNRDGILDLVTAGGTAASVSLGVGDGTFVATRSYAANSDFTNAISLKDVNNDGILDLITAGQSAGSGSASVRLGIGDGTFGAATSYATEASTSWAVTLGDINADGNIDLITAGNNSFVGYASVRLGNGDGTFETMTSYAMESVSSYDIELVDVNRDGLIDLVTTGASGGGVGSATIRLNSGNGTFGAATSYEMNGNIGYEVEVADINNDGFLDLFAAGTDVASQGEVAMRLGDGNGTFGAVTSFLTSETQATLAMSIGDINGDGILDIVTGGRSASGALTSIYLGVGNATFSLSSTLSTAGANRTLAIELADMNQDGVVDIVTVGNSQEARVHNSITSDGVQPLAPFDLLSRSNALDAISQFDLALARLSEQRGIVGAFESRLGSALGVLYGTTENYAAAESRIRDIDVATESSNLVRLNILRDVGAAILAQANQAPSLALSLLVDV